MEQLLQVMDAYIAKYEHMPDDKKYKPAKKTLARIEDLPGMISFIYDVFTKAYNAQYERLTLSSLFEVYFPIKVNKIREMSDETKQRVFEVICRRIETAEIESSDFPFFFDKDRYALKKDRLKFVTGDSEVLQKINFVDEVQVKEHLNHYKQLAITGIRIVMFNEYEPIVFPIIDIVRSDYISRTSQYRLISKHMLSGFCRKDDEVTKQAVEKLKTFSDRYNFKNHISTLEKYNQLGNIYDYMHLYSEEFKQKIKPYIEIYFETKFEKITANSNVSYRNKAKEIIRLRKEMVELHVNMYEKTGD